MTRMFVALVPPDAAVEHLDEFLEPRRATGELRWVAAEQLHVTLALLEQVPDRRVDELVERLGAAAARRTTFPARVSGGGAFPDVARGRVLWAGLDLDEDDATELDLLAAGARTAAATSGVEVDGARFRAHLSVARLRRPTELTRWVQLLDGYAGPTWTADRVTLVASYLGEGPRGRPRHEPVAELILG